MYLARIKKFFTMIKIRCTDTDSAWLPLLTTNPSRLKRSKDTASEHKQSRAPGGIMPCGIEQGHPEKRQNKVKVPDPPTDRRTNRPTHWCYIVACTRPKPKTIQVTKI